MSNQVLMWSMFIVPWLTLFFMKKEDIKRYMPAGLFGGLTSEIIGELGVTAGLWGFREVAYPLAFIPPFVYGANFIVPMWVLKFTYGRYWLYTITNAVLDIGFAWGLFLWYANRGIFEIGPYTNISVYAINFVHAAVIYGYHMWQEDIFTRSARNKFSPGLQSVAAKPLDTDDKDNLR